MSVNAPSTPRSWSPASNTQGPLPAIIQLSRPYLSPIQIKNLEEKTAHANGSRDQQLKFQAFSVILATGNYLRFPIRTMGTAMIIFQRFYLFNTMQDFPSTLDTAHACLFVASKTEDTLKKLKEILLASYHIKHPTGPDISMDSPVIEDQRRRLISLERHVLETMSFDFRVRHPQSYIMKFAKHLRCKSRSFVQFNSDLFIDPAPLAETAWQVALDSYKTLVPLKRTPHAVALGCLYIAASLLECDVSGLNPERFCVPPGDFENVVLELLEFYIDWLPQTMLSTRYPDPAPFMSMRIELNKRVGKYSEIRASGAHLRLRDHTMGDKGTVRYVLNWERERLERDELY
ncbi:cyclin-like protein [Lipomyces orientalis]|uniref:Cyclin-like protein n=1 Tax=Lipomyces orientalis TaxID=1233043 RepID=A0ACC3TQT8_9ASCO